MPTSRGPRRLGAVFGLLFFLVAPCRAQQFRIGDYLAQALVGEAGLIDGRDYISFAGDTAFVNWLPREEVLDRYVAAEKGLLSHFQMNVVNFEHVLVGFSGKALDERIDATLLSTLRSVDYQLVSMANNHALDAGARGVSFSADGLQGAGLKIIGLRSHPVYLWNVGGRGIAIYSMTISSDFDDAQRLTLKLDNSDLALVRRMTAAADFRIAFVHLGSMSSFPSDHERDQIEKLIDAGADLIVCTGSHFVKGFVRERGKPVFYGLGDHLLSSVNAGTESVGMHVVAGFAEGQLKQLFIVPFWNSIYSGKVGPLDARSFDTFLGTFRDRSTTDSSRYYSDPRTRGVLSHRLRHLELSDLKDIRFRQVAYAARILWHNYPFAVAGAGGLIALTIVALARWARLSRLRRARGAVKGV